jgi:hypothetical protein
VRRLISSSFGRRSPSVTSAVCRGGCSRKSCRQGNLYPPRRDFKNDKFIACSLAPAAKSLSRIRLAAPMSCRLGDPLKHDLGGSAADCRPHTLKHTRSFFDTTYHSWMHDNSLRCTTSWTRQFQGKAGHLKPHSLRLRYLPTF